MKTTKMTKKIAALFAAAMMIATVSVCASAEAARAPKEDTNPSFSAQGVGGIQQEQFGVRV
ncbi:MAG: hypothetical protein IK093_00375 [Ruminiclostridium sp.]|nr:hypothetical protein [Ruminiclostridium sp.]